MEVCGLAYHVQHGCHFEQDELLSFKWSSIIYLSSSHHVWRDSSYVQRTPQPSWETCKVFDILAITAFLQPEQSQLSHHERHPVSPKLLWLFMSKSLLHSGVQNWTQNSRCVSPVLSIEERWPPVPVGTVPLRQPRMPMANLVHGQLGTQQDPSDSTL